MLLHCSRRLATAPTSFTRQQASSSLLHDCKSRLEVLLDVELYELLIAVSPRQARVGLVGVTNEGRGL